MKPGKLTLKSGSRRYLQDHSKRRRQIAFTKKPPPFLQSRLGRSGDLSAFWSTIQPRFAREMRLHWPEPGDVGSVLQLGQLAAGKLLHETQVQEPAAFTLPPAITAWVLESLKGHDTHQTWRPAQAFAEQVVLTASAPDQIQATTVQQYLEQTWPDDSSFILQVFQRLPDFIGTTVVMSNTDTVVSLAGPPLAVVQRAEQLAWLCAAIQASLGSASDRGLIYVHLDPRESHDNCLIASVHKHWDIRLHSKPFGDVTDPTRTLSLLRPFQRLGVLKSLPPIIGGFPTARRPDDDSGIELPSHILFGTAMSHLKLQAAGMVVSFHGKELSLKLIKNKDADVFVWHTHCSESPCTCQLQMYPTPDGSSSSWLDLATLNLPQSRHIIAACSSASACDERAAPLPMDEMTGTCSEDRFPLASRLPDWIESVAEESAWESSVETEEFSSASEDEPIADPYWDEVLSPFADVVVGRFLGDLESQGPAALLRKGEATLRVRPSGVQGASSQAMSGASISHPHGAGGQLPRSQGKGKGRARHEQDQESDGEESQRRRPKKQRLRDASPDAMTRQLACLFWKLDPRKHRDCFGLTLENTSRVKQHLKRKHTPKYYCERCWAEFADEHSHAEHVKVEVMACPSRTCRFPAITHQQEMSLRRRSTSVTAEARWFEMWDIVFPDSPRPSSPYIDSELSEELCGLMEFASAHGPAIVIAEIQSSVRAGSADPGISEERLAAFLQRAVTPRCLSRIFERWLANSAPATTSPQPGAPAQPTAAATTSSSVSSESSRDEPASDAISPMNQQTPASSVSCLDNDAMIADRPGPSRPLREGALSGRSGIGEAGHAEQAARVVPHHLQQWPPNQPEGTRDTEVGHSQPTSPSNNPCISREEFSTKTQFGQVGFGCGQEGEWEQFLSFGLNVYHGLDEVVQTETGDFDMIGEGAGLSIVLGDTMSTAQEEEEFSSVA